MVLDGMLATFGPIASLAIVLIDEALTKLIKTLMKLGEFTEKCLPCREAAKLLVKAGDSGYLPELLLKLF